MASPAGREIGDLYRIVNDIAREHRAEGAREEREAVVAALKRRRAFLAEMFEPDEVRLRDDELDELLRIVEAGEHRKP